jgi:glyoxylase-like metal-dependent hydrolase (beta-lactamase superfamily II)
MIRDRASADRVGAMRGSDSVFGVQGSTSEARRRSDDWLDVRRIRRDLYVLTDWLGDTHPRFGPIYTHSYLLLGDERAALIDTGVGFADLRDAVSAITDLPVDVLLTHNHSDHIGGSFVFDTVCVAAADAEQLEHGLREQDAGFVAEYESRTTRRLPRDFDFAPYLKPERWARRPDRVLESGDVVQLGGLDLEVITTPGHTPGSCCFLDVAGGRLFSGDTVYEGNLNIQLDSSDFAAYPASIDALLSIADGTDVLPGHYATPVSSGIIRDVRDGLERMAAGNVDYMTVSPDWLEADFESFSITIPAAARPRCPQDHRGI